MLKRDELHDQHAVVRSLGNGEVEFAPAARISRHVVDLAFGFRDKLAQARMVRGGCIDRGELGRKRFDCTLRLHDLADRHPGQIELNRERFGKQPGIAAGNTCSASGADLDLDNALRLQGSQSVARNDPADIEALRKLLLGAEKIAGTKLLRKQGLAHLVHDSGRERGAAKWQDVARAALKSRM